ncbi:MAG: phytanoyl-CoA dioxygenase family protein [Planctomycetes bacterium]|nr:phytanoyl-CoA dioxygenase family protein [Planctomycetota bacterium]
MPNLGQPHLTRLEHLNRYGYYTDHDLFTPDHLGRLRDALARLQRDAKPEYDHAHQTYFPNIIEFDDAFAEVLDNTRLLEGLFEVIGPDVQLYANEVLVSKPTGKALGWHRDKMSIGKHCPNMFLKVCLYVDELTIDAGPTGVVPESHFDIYKGEEFYPHKIDFLAKPGSMLAFAASTMHRAGLHVEGKPPRPAMFFVFIPWWIKQAVYYTGHKCQKLIDTASPMRLQLLGVQMRPGISMDSFTSV